MTGNSYAFDNATDNAAEVLICKDTRIRRQTDYSRLGRAGRPASGLLITGFRADVGNVICRRSPLRLKSNVSPGATVTVNEWLCRHGRHVCVFVNFATPLWRAINRTLPGAL